MPTSNQYRDFRYEDLLPAQLQGLSTTINQLVAQELEIRHGLSLNEWRVMGKTGTKESLAAALRRLGKTHHTLGNQNNRYGLPLTLARLPESADYGVFEIGMDHVHPIEGGEDLAATVAPLVQPGDLVVCLGAGTITQWANALPAQLSTLDGTR